MHKLKSTHIKLQPDQRLYGTAMPLIGLTGGIASGKSSVSQELQKLGIPLIDADKLIHHIYQQQETVNFIDSLVPEVVTDGTINFRELRSLFFNNSSHKKEIETFLYQKLPQTFESHLNFFKQGRYQYCFYDVPLLFEKQLQDKVDVSILVYCSPEKQLQRLMKRDNISAIAAQAILKHQIPIDKKRMLADHIIENEGSLEQLKLRVNELILKITTNQ